MVLRQARATRGWSQEQLAELLDTSNVMVYRWERGLTVPGPYYRQKLSALFDLPLEDLGLLSTPTLNFLPLSLFRRLPTSLIGRSTLMQTLKHYLCMDALTEPVALMGLPGVGKTALALALAHDPELRSHFYDGILWAGLGPRPNLLAVLHSWGNQLQMSETQIASSPNLEDLSLAIQRRLQAKHLLIVFDDVWALNDALSLKLGGPCCTYLLTTRLPVLAHQFALEHTWTVPELTETESLALLMDLAPDVPGQDTLHQVLRQVGGLPLALILIGRYLQRQALTHQPRRLTNALKQLTQAKERIYLAESIALPERPPSLATGTPLSLQASLAVSVNVLPFSARVLLSSLAVLPAKPHSFAEDVVLALEEREPAAILTDLDQLVDSGLVECIALSRYTIHQTIVDFLRLEGMNPLTQDRLMAYGNVLFSQDISAYEAILQELPLVLTILAMMQERAPDQFLTSATHLTHVLITHGQLALGRSLAETALDLAAAAGRHAEMVTLHIRLGRIALQEGQTVQAEQWAHKGRILTDDSLLTATLLHIEGVALERQGYANAARAAFVEGITLVAKDDIPIRAKLFLALGALYAEQGESSQALVSYDEGLALCRRLNLVDGIAAFCMNRGNELRQQGRYNEAHHSYDEAWERNVNGGSHEIRAQLLANRTTLALLRGDFLHAQSYVTEGLQLTQAAGMEVRQSNFFRLQADIAVHQEQWETARIWAQRSLDTLQKTSYQAEIAWSWITWAQIAAASTQWEIVATTLDVLEQLTHSELHVDLTLQTLLLKGRYNIAQNHLEQAMQVLEEACSQAKRYERRETEALSLFGLAQVMYQQGDITHARDLGVSSSTILQDLGAYQARNVFEWLALMEEGEFDWH